MKINDNLEYTCTCKCLQIFWQIFIPAFCGIATSNYLLVSEFVTCFNSSVPLPMLFFSVWNFLYASLHSIAHPTHSQILLGALPIFFYIIAYQTLMCILVRSFFKCRVPFSKSKTSVFITKVPKRCWCCCSWDTVL